MCLVSALLLGGTVAAAEKVEFNRDIRPILSDTCFACHGPDKSKRKAKLRLDDRASAIEKAAIVPGKPHESELIARLLLPAGDEQRMPPAEMHKTITPKQIETLKTWIEQGAEYQPHWAYMPIVKSAVPKAAGRNAIDAFIVAELEKRGIKPSPEADQRTLIRRLYLDLHGLPPAPEAVAAFVANKSPDAYEKLVDKLLADPAYAERMTVPWLDLVRFADTVGYHGDQNQRIFPYRDYIINSFHTNKPFDQFTREQLAGDLLPKPTTEQLVATGFNRLNMMTREGGAQPKEYIAKYQADRVRTVGITWLGSTLGCAECHDHKFDPITAKDFYGMAAFFADIRQWGVYSDYGYTPNPDLKGWSNDHPFPPEIEVPSPYLVELKERLTRDLGFVAADAYGDIDVVTDTWRLYEVWRNDTTRAFDKSPTGTPFINPQPYEDIKTDEEHRFVVTRKVKKADTLTLRLTPAAGWIASVQIELLPHATHKNSLSRDGQPVTVATSLAVRDKAGKMRPLAIFDGIAENADVVKWASTSPVRNVVSGWRISGEHLRRPQVGRFLLDQPFRLQPDEELVITLKSDNVGCIRVATSPLAEAPSAAFISGRTKATGTEEESRDYAIAFLLSTASDKNLLSKARKIFAQLQAIRTGTAWSQVTVATTPITTRLLPRGNWMDETGPVTPPAVPGFLPQLGVKDRRLNRLDLADWVVSKENPLTARVFVNRLWKQIFGTGLSGVMEDVGGQGEWPTHPELLDYLASEFRDTWDVKRMVKLLVMSATYRQISTGRPELKDVDPSNRLLAYLPPRRLEAEFVRDNALAAAGLLNRDRGGPSVKPYQPDGYYANIQFPNRNYQSESDRRQYRRGLYMHWQRTFLHPMLANFDAPGREECTASRTCANTPQQALTLLNDPTFVEAARVLATSVTQQTKTEDEALTMTFQRVLARDPTPAERAPLMKLLASQKTYYAANPDEAKKLMRIGFADGPRIQDTEVTAAWTSVCRVVLNLHEAFTRY